MANTYSWIIRQLECYPDKDGKKDVVFTVYWRRKADNGAGCTADVYGSEALTLDPAAPFTPYNQLTKEQVESWLVGSIGVAGVAKLDADLDKQIEDLVNPPVVRPPLPWGD